MKALALLIIGFALASAPASATGAPKGDSGCLGCHPGFTSPMPPGNPAKGPLCTACHLGRGQAEKLDQGHLGLAANPSALGHAKRACGPCHGKRPDMVSRSPMATAAGIINQTRFLWGAQPDARPRFAVRAVEGLKALGPAGDPARPVDDFLRRRCLRCHLWAEGADMPGARRSSGCAACHRPTNNQGKHVMGHKLTRKVPVSQCLRCHAGCGAGGEYAGRIPRDANRQAAFMAQDPNRPRLWQGRSWRAMTPDLHYMAGLACQDCHHSSEIMGDGRIRPAGLLHVGVRCASCHGGPGQTKLGFTSFGKRLGHVRATPAGAVVKTKLGGLPLSPPPYSKNAKAPVAHQVAEHANVACHACHSATNPAEWGLMALLETRAQALGQWSFIRAQGDPQLLKLLRPHGAEPGPPQTRPRTRDYLDGRSHLGAWILSPFFRRFEWRVYGKGPGGRTFLLAPRFQYLVTLLDNQGRLIRSAQKPGPGLGVTPWRPHAAARPTLGCAGCHGNASALGLGMTFVSGFNQNGGPRLAPNLWQPHKEGLAGIPDWTRVVSLSGRAQQSFLVPGSRPYTQKELLRLLKPGKQYKRMLLKELDQRGYGR